MNHYQATGVFFVDVTYLMALNQYGQEDTFKKVANQIQDIVSQGARVELHFHPHWLDAVLLDASRWRLDNTRQFRLQDMSQESMKRLFHDGVQLLQQIVTQVDADYQLLSYRFGGFCNQPFEPLINSFKEYGIMVDSSVNPGFFSRKKPHYYDHRQAPKSDAFWRFQNNPVIPNSQGEFLEIPISTYKIPGALIVLNQFLNRNNRIMGDGESATMKTSLLKKMVRVLGVEYRHFTIDNTSSWLFHYSLNKLLKSDLSFLTLISHPKLLTESGLQNLEYLLQRFKTITLEEIKLGKCS